MKSVFTRIAAALVAAAAVLCFAACSESSSGTESKNDSVTTTKATGAQQQEDRLISFSVQPGGENRRELITKGNGSRRGDKVRPSGLTDGLGGTTLELEEPVRVKILLLRVGYR